MYQLTKRIEVAGSHKLKLPYESPCNNAHGHNWIIKVYIEGEELNAHGMLIDFKSIKKVVDRLDHTNVNEIFPKGWNPTAENIAEWVCEQIQGEIHVEWDQWGNGREPVVKKVSVQESEGNSACFIA